jgi:Ca-activated chloride channel family protein
MKTISNPTPPHSRPSPSSSKSSDDRGRTRRTRTKIAALAVVFVIVLVLVLESVRDPNFWITADQRSDILFQAGKFAQAAKVSADPWRLGTAQYRNGDFEAAAKTFARLPGAIGAYNQGNASLMHGKYDQAIASYDRALGFRLGWREAEENKALALARKAKIEASGQHRDEEQTTDEKADDIVFDQKGDDQKGKPVELAEGEMSDEQLRATWLRQVQTTPGDFLRAKFAYQAADAEQQNVKKSE